MDVGTSVVSLTLPAFSFVLFLGGLIEKRTGDTSIVTHGSKPDGV